MTNHLPPKGIRHAVDHVTKRVGHLIICDDIQQTHCHNRFDLMAFAWALPRCAFHLRSTSRLRIVSKPMSTHQDCSQMDQPLHVSSIDAEPLYRYRQGGYHPVTLGQYLKAGRYKVLHKLGWGGYSTVWAARDQRLDNSWDLRSF